MIRYVVGDATAPEGDGLRVIAHVCNDRRAWGAGFVMALSRRWVEPERLYRERSTLRLGEVMFATVEDEIMVANMVAQHGFPTANRPCALDYDALAICLVTVAEFCAQEGASVHAPRFGAGIAGGDWREIEKLISGTLGALDVPVTIYDLPGAH